MPHRERDISIVHHILDYCNQISETVLHFGNDWNLFVNNKIYQNATALCILQIGELTGKLSDEFKIEYPGMPWHQIKAMRNIVAHDYGSVSISVVWEIITEDIPCLEQYCKEIVNAEQPK